MEKPQYMLVCSAFLAERSDVDLSKIYRGESLDLILDFCEDESRAKPLLDQESPEWMVLERRGDRLRLLHYMVTDEEIDPLMVSPERISNNIPRRLSLRTARLIRSYTRYYYHGNKMRQESIKQ